jgi:hypothetical protein
MLGELAQWLDDQEARPRNAFSHWSTTMTEKLVASGVIFADGYLPSLICTACHEGHRALLKSSPRGPRYYCRHAGWTYPATEETVAYRIDPLAFARAIAASMDIPTKGVREKARARLYLLGDVSIAGSMRTLFLARQSDTARHISELAMLVDSAGSKNTGFVLCAGEAPSVVRTKHRHQFCPLADTLTDRSDSLGLDKKQLEALARDLDRNRNRSHAPEAESKDWKTEAASTWKQLHDEGELGPKVSQMARLVVRRMLKEGWSAADLPAAKALGDELRSLHRRHYPARRAKRPTA